MRTIKHPLAGAFYDLTTDGHIEVTKDGHRGLFTSKGTWIEGEIRQRSLQELVPTVIAPMIEQTVSERRGKAVRLESIGYVMVQTLADEEAADRMRTLLKNIGVQLQTDPIETTELARMLSYRRQIGARPVSIKSGAEVVVAAGPFKGHTVEIVAIDSVHNEYTVFLKDATTPMKTTIPRTQLLGDAS